MHLTLKLTITGQNNFVEGQKYTFTHKTIPLESITFRYIQKSRIDGLPIFHVAKSDVKSYSLSDYEFPNITITNIDLIKSLEDHIGNWNQSTYHKNSSILVEYCMDHFKLSKSDLGDDTKFKHMMREIILNGLLPKEDNK